MADFPPHKYMRSLQASHTVEGGVERTSMQTGTPRQVTRWSGIYKKAPRVIVFDGNQFPVFEQWFIKDIGQGADWFDLIWPEYQDNIKRRTRIENGAYSAVYLNQDPLITARLIEVALTFETLFQDGQIL